MDETKKQLPSGSENNMDCNTSDTLDMPSKTNDIKSERIISLGMPVMYPMYEYVFKNQYPIYHYFSCIEDRQDDQKK